MKPLNQASIEEAGAEEDRNSVRSPGSEEYRTTFDHIAAVRREIVNMELESCMAFDRWIAAAHTEVDRIPAENTAAEGMSVVRIAVEYKANCKKFLAMERRQL